MTRHDRYVFATGDPMERERLRTHADLWDAFTFRKLEETGVGAGWRCLEIGAGTGSVAAWLVDRVGHHGQVVATDIETRWLEPMASPTFVVRHHNVVHDPIEAQGYDLIHARLVLEHLPDPRAVATKLVAAIRPGGWLVVEDYDIATMAVTTPAMEGWARVNDAVVDVLRAAGSNPLFGRELGSTLRAAGLDPVSTEGYVKPVTIPELAPTFRSPLDQLRGPLLHSGQITETDLEQAMHAFEQTSDPPVAYTPILVAASGRLSP